MTDYSKTRMVNDRVMVRMVEKESPSTKLIIPDMIHSKVRKAVVTSISPNADLDGVKVGDKVLVNTDFIAWFEKSFQFRKPDPKPGELVIVSDKGVLAKVEE